MEQLTRGDASVGYLRPVVASREVPDTRTELIRHRYGPQVAPTTTATVDIGEVAARFADGGADGVLDAIVTAARELEARFDVVVFDGADYLGTAAAVEFDVNVRMARDLGAAVVAVVDGARPTAQQVLEAVHVARGALHAAGCTVAALIANRVDPAMLAEVRARLLADDLAEPCWAIPEVASLTHPTVREVADALDAKLLLGRPADLDHEISGIRTAAMSLPNVLDHIEQDGLLLAAGDRPEIVVCALTSWLASSFPDLAALLLTGGFPLDPRIQRLLDGLGDIHVPVLAVEGDTFTTAQAVGNVPAVIGPATGRRTEIALETFRAHVDADALARAIDGSRAHHVTPMMFTHDLLHRARRHRQRIVLPESEDERILRAAGVLLARDVVDLVLLGDAERVRSRASALGLDLGGTQVIDPATSPLRDGFAASYAELRAHRGVSAEVANERMRDATYFATMLVHEGFADGLVSGAVHTTENTVRPALEVIRTRPEVAVVSSVFLMCLRDRVLVYGDCAINPEPDAETLADIAVSCANTASAFGIEPRVAMLSYSTGTSGRGAAVDRVHHATELVRARCPELEVDGPIQYDAAVDATVGDAKLPGSKVAGRASVFVFPDLNTGNNTYKAVQRSADALAIGPVLQGLNRPVNDLSRGCSVDDVVNTVVITAIQAAAS